MRKNKAAKQAAPANTAALTAAAAKCKANANTTAQPGIISSIMQQLTNAKQSKKPLTAQELLTQLSKQFPQRAAAGMLVTVRAQLSRLPSEKDFAISKVRDGRVVRYAAK